MTNLPPPPICEVCSKLLADHARGAPCRRVDLDVPPKGALLKLHLGCGPRYFPGWVHIDAVEHPHVQICHAVDSLPMVADDAIDIIYCCHVFEHFSRREAPRVLAEWRRVLRPGGLLRLSVPDFEAIAKGYCLWGFSLDQLHGLLFGRQDYLYNIHYAVYDFPTLSEMLLSADFLTPQCYDWTETEHAHVDDYSQAYLPHHDRANGLQMSLNIEARKPGEATE